MTFLAPWNLAWLGLLVPLGILYVLKRRRQERPVGSTLLWEQALRDLRAERPWKRLTPQVSLLLQALVIVAGSLALARPAGVGRAPRGARTVVVLDVSASMGARVDGERRLDRATAVARSIADALPPGGELMIVEASADPVVRSPFERDATALGRTLDAVQVRGARADLESAVALAADRLQGAPAGSRVVVLTDAALDGTLALDAGAVSVEVQRVGGEAANSAIVDADARARTDDPDRADLFARITHHGPSTADLYVTAHLVGQEAAIASRRVRIAPDTVESVLFTVDLPPDAAGRSPVVELSLAAADGSTDALPEDDRAVVPSPGRGKLPVFLVGTAPAAVERVVRADARVEVFRTSLARLAERDPDAPPLEGLFVYTGDVPAEAPAGDSVVIAPAGDRVFELEVGEETAAPQVLTWDEADPRLRFTSFRDVHLATLRPLVGPAARALVTTSGGSAIATIARSDGETTVLGFDPTRSDWPRQPSFVVFFRNLLERARERRAAGGVPPGTLGEPLRVPAPEGATVAVETPGGETLSAVSRGGLAVVPIPAEPGVFRARVEGGAERFALRSLLDAEESDLRPRLEVTRGGERATGALVEAEEHAESWPWVAGLLLVLLLAEVAWASRREAAA
ncbi:MAG: hypothetical protein CMN30_30875 [Sandaracinus sp.]|nr:hypothetical protein [Sandaracinus sp.]